MHTQINRFYALLSWALSSCICSRFFVFFFSLGVSIWFRCWTTNDWPPVPRVCIRISSLAFLKFHFSCGWEYIKHYIYRVLNSFQYHMMSFMCLYFAIEMYCACDSKIVFFFILRKLKIYDRSQVWKKNIRLRIAFILTWIPLFH